MRVLAILPARMGSSRFPGKPLHNICGIPMIGHCYLRAKMATQIDDVYVATCDKEIFDYVEQIGGKCVMTSQVHNRATDRTAEAMLKIEAALGERIDIVIMIQGDEPLITPDAITATLEHFSDPSVDVVNIMSRIQTRDTFEDKNNVKVVVNKSKDALYFSREPIPSAWKGHDQVSMYMQVGVIAFRRAALLQFNLMSESPLEKIESVDMNRILEAGGKIRMAPIENITIGVDTLEEAEQVSAILINDPIFIKYST